MINQNERCLLKFISCVNCDTSKSDGILECVVKMGIDVKFKDYNPVYQIIDELNFSNYKSSLIGK